MCRGEGRSGRLEFLLFNLSQFIKVHVLKLVSVVYDSRLMDIVVKVRKRLHCWPHKTAVK